MSHDNTPAYTWPTGPERYCVDSGRAVRMIPGDRCVAHGNHGEMCTTAIRVPGKCRHDRLSPNHPYPHCAECGLDARPAS
jgi:hypothetical protein